MLGEEKAKMKEGKIERKKKINKIGVFIFGFLK